MFEEREIVLAFVKDIYPPKKKFFITLYRDEELNIVACFTTSQYRLPIDPAEARHGVIRRKDGAPVAYVFEKDRTIGKVPQTNNPFSFFKRTMVTFDYCFQSGSWEKFMQRTDPTNRETVCIMDHQEFVDLLYAMYQSPLTNRKLLPMIEKSLEKYSSLDLLDKQ
ncbi:MAG: hypothetical protein NC048_02855 [Bacteroides sp.]|nr:hypothetical protein [Ruminococcus flavefaciens]MCM1554417.1 hypothetical protein [Bacteroides sp.]